MDLIILPYEEIGLISSLIPTTVVVREGKRAGCWTKQ